MTFFVSTLSTVSRGGIERPAQVQRRTAVRITVFNHQILNLFRIDERGGEGMLFRLDVVVVLEAVGSEQFLHFPMRPGRDLVDHGPREGDLALVFQVVQEGLGGQPVPDPALRIGEDAGFHLVAVVRAVIHRLNGEGQLSSIVALEQQGADLTHGEEGLQASGEVGLVVGVALLGNGKGDHLEGGVTEDLHQTLPVGELGISLEGLGDAGDDFLLDGARRLETDEQREVVVRGIGLVDDLEVEGLGDDDATVVLACVQGIVEDGCGEGTEDVSATEVYPCGFLGGLLADGLDVELRKLIAFGFPFCGVEIAAKNIIQFHRLNFLGTNYANFTNSIS